MYIAVRNVTETDIDALFEIRTSVTQNHLSRAQMTELGITSELLTNLINQHPCAWIAEVDGTAAAFSMVDIEAGEVFALFTRPEYEGFGLGRLLMSAAEKYLFTRHEKIWLITDGREGIRANGFYQHLGWSQVAAVDEIDVRYEKRRPSAV